MYHDDPRDPAAGDFPRPATEAMPNLLLPVLPAS